MALSKADKEAIREKITKLQEQIKKLENIPESASLMYPSMSDDFSGYILENGERVYLR